MNSGLLLLIVMVLPAALLVAAIVFITYDQDRRGIFIVQLIDGASLDVVLVDHTKRFDIVVQQSWGTAGSPGYRASIKHRSARRLRHDARVLSVVETDN